MDLPLKNLKGAVVGTIEVSDAVFDVPFRPTLVHQVMVGHLANRRVGTHSTKTRAEVRGGGRKPWRQKGTGRARQGSIRSPQWRGGGVVFGPKPRDYHHHTPRKMRQEAIRCLLAQKIRTLADLGIGAKCLVVSGEPAPDLARAYRNLRRVKSLPAYTLNTLDLLNYDHLLMSVGAVRKVEALWDKRQPEPQPLETEPGGAPENGAAADADQAEGAAES